MRPTTLILLVGMAWLAGLALPEAQPAGTAPDASRTRGSMPPFVHSGDCVACHNRLTAPSGEDVSIGSMWRASMMANSARDPYWQASVRRETMDHPSRTGDIENECAACHMPMSQRMAQAAGRQGAVLAHLPFSGTDASDEHRLAGDGVSCTVCHQMAEDRLGTAESFNANFVLVPPGPSGARQILGPHAVDAGRRRIMRSVTGYEQVEAPHIQRSELCASCHTLITEAFGPDGRVVGRLPEQMNYQEWLHSAFPAEERSCQACHMPRAAGPVRISSVLGDHRDGLARHVFVGGNAFMLRLLNRYRGALGVEADPLELEATTQATLRQLQQETATVTIASTEVSVSSLAFAVDVHVLTGHKFPTGYPARRAWIHAVVRDGEGGVVFESGAVLADGSIQGNDADADASRFEPHYREVSDAREVQIYEPILGDPAGRPTTGLLQATRYLKDNRLLPRGFDKGTAPADIGVYGEALDDPDFGAAGDRVRFRVDIGSAPGPFAIDVELRYQPIGFRWARNLEPYDAPEPRRFLDYFRSLSSFSSSVVARATARASR
jgi:hypothetical protein